MKHWLQGSIIVVCLLLALPCCAARKHSQATVSTNKDAHLSSLLWESYPQAMKLSLQDGKPVCLFFTGSDWCIWCVKMQQQILSSEEFISFAQSYLHMVELDFPQNPAQPGLSEYRHELKSRYDVKGFPQLVFIDGEGKELARMGFEYGGGASYVEKIKAALRIRS